MGVKCRKGSLKMVCALVNTLLRGEEQASGSALPRLTAGSDGDARRQAKKGGRQGFEGTQSGRDEGGQSATRHRRATHQYHCKASCAQAHIQGAVMVQDHVWMPLCVREINSERDGERAGKNTIEDANNAGRGEEWSPRVSHHPRSQPFSPS